MMRDYKEEIMSDQLREENNRLREAFQLLTDQMRDIGSEWRNDWTWFDGRTLQAQIEGAIRKATTILKEEADDE